MSEVKQKLTEAEVIAKFKEKFTLLTEVEVALLYALLDGHEAVQRGDFADAVDCAVKVDKLLREEEAGG